MTKLDFEKTWVKLRIVENLEDLYADLFQHVSKIDTVAKAYGKIVQGYREKIEKLQIANLYHDDGKCIQDLTAMLDHANNTIDSVDAQSICENFSQKLEELKNNNELEDEINEKWHLLKQINEEIIKINEKNLFACSERADEILNEYKNKLTEYEMKETEIVRKSQQKMERFLVEEFQKQRAEAVQQLLDGIRQKAEEKSSEILDFLAIQNRSRNKELEYEESLRNQVYELKLKILNHPRERCKRQLELEENLLHLQEKAKKLELCIKYGKNIYDEESLTIWEEYKELDSQR